MSVTFDCPACMQRISAAVAAGVEVRCPLCGVVVTVPSGGATAPILPPTPPSHSPYPTSSAPSPQLNQSMAIAALVTGILGMVACPLVGLVGLVLGIVAVRRTTQSPRQYGGRGLAIAGICTGGVSVLMMGCMAVFFVPNAGTIWREFQSEFEIGMCEENPRAIMNALQIDAQDTGYFAPNLQTLVANGLLTVDQLECPGAPAGVTSYYYVPGYQLDSDLEQIILFENPLNHGGEGGHIVRIDGIVEFIASPEDDEAVADITLPAGTPFEID